MRVGRLGELIAVERPLGLRGRSVALFNRNGGYLGSELGEVKGVEWAPWRLRGLDFVPLESKGWRMDVVLARRKGWTVGVWLARPGYPVVVVTGPDGLAVVAELWGQGWRRWKRLERVVEMLKMGGEE